MASDALDAANLESCLLMHKALENILRSSSDLKYQDVQRVVKAYHRVIMKKRSLHAVLSCTMELSCGLTHTELEEINKLRLDLIADILPLIHSVIDLCDKNEMIRMSPGKARLIYDLQSVAQELGCSDTSALENTTLSAPPTASSDTGLGSSGAPSVDLQAIGSLEDVSKTEKGRDSAGICRFLDDLDSALMVIDNQWIPPRIPIIMGEISNYPKEALDCFADEPEDDGSARIFIHFGLIFVRKHDSPVHAAVAAAVVIDLWKAFNKNLHIEEFVGQGELKNKYCNRLGCGYEVPKRSDGGIGFSFRSSYFRQEEHLLAVEVAFTHENLLGIYLEAALYLGPDTNVRFFVGVRVSPDFPFWVKIYIIRKTPDPKPKNKIFGKSKEKCPVPKKALSVKVGDVDVVNDELEGWSAAEVNETFDIDLLQILEANHSDFDQHGELLEPNRFSWDVELDLGPDDIRNVQMRFSETIIRAYVAWCSYRRGLGLHVT